MHVTLVENRSTEPVKPGSVSLVAQPTYSAGKAPYEPPPTAILFGLRFLLEALSRTKGRHDGHRIGSENEFCRGVGRDLSKPCRILMVARSHAHIVRGARPTRRIRSMTNYLDEKCRRIEQFAEYLRRMGIRRRKIVKEDDCYLIFD